MQDWPGRNRFCTSNDNAKININSVLKSDQLSKVNKSKAIPVTGREGP
jgi:hypothetical protein